MITAKVTSKGQITIPKKIRVRLGIQPGEEVEFVEDEDAIRIRKTMKRSPFDKWMGYLGRSGVIPGESDSIVEDMRSK